jgi:hypothetical protein
VTPAAALLSATAPPEPDVFVEPSAAIDATQKRLEDKASTKVERQAGKKVMEGSES